MKEKIQMSITLIIVCAYTYLVVIGKAPIDGFGMLAVYVIKKFLDMAEDEKNQPAPIVNQVKTEEPKGEIKP